MNDMASQITRFENEIRIVFEQLSEKQKRLSAAVLYKIIGYGHQDEIAKVTGVSSSTILRGCREIDNGVICPDRKRVRKPGAGRPPIQKKLHGRRKSQANS
jgi:hypothetical protein